MATSGEKITLYNLRTSRSYRILIALEELKLPYQVKTFEREENMLAPAELKEKSPTGTAPFIEDGDVLLAESGAILEYLAEKGGRMGLPSESLAMRNRYRFYLHGGEGTLMALVQFNMVMTMTTAATPWIIRPVVAKVHDLLLDRYIRPRVERFLEVVEKDLKGSEFFAGSEISMADCQMFVPLEVVYLGSGPARPLVKEAEKAYPQGWAWLVRMKARESAQNAAKMQQGRAE